MSRLPTIRSAVEAGYEIKTTTVGRFVASAVGRNETDLHDTIAWLTEGLPREMSLNDVRAALIKMGGVE